MENPWQDESVLRELYCEKGLSQAEVAEELGCGEGTVNRWIHKHDIEVSATGSTNNTIRNVDLHTLYWREGFSQTEIADMCDCSVALVSKQMKEQDIPTKGGDNGLPTLYTRSSDGHEFFNTAGCGKQFAHHRLLAVVEWGFEKVVGSDVHHRNEIPWDNRIENLDVLSHGEHTTHHNNQRDWNNVRRNDDGTIQSFQ